MRYRPLSASFYRLNRNKFSAELDTKSLAIFNSNDIYPISADSTLPFAQHRDIFYLSGIDQEESILLIFPDALEKKHEEMISVEESRNTIDLKDKYVIYQQNNQKQIKYYKKKFNGKLIKNLFSYNSRDNKNFLKIKDLKNLIAQYNNV